ncbi:MAG: hypothetical protein ACKVS9_03025 [Phycisphaerae bacterium]
MQGLLDTAIAGRMDELSPEQIERLAAHLDESLEAAALLADATPPMMVGSANAVALPTEREWSRVWSGVESAGAARVERVRRGRVIRFTQSFAALAACVGIVFMMQRAGIVQRADVTQLASGVEIRELDVAAGYTAKIDLDEDGGSAVIWIYEDASDEGV